VSAGRAGDETLEISPVGRGETRAAARVLAAAFLDDPIAIAIGPRRRWHRRLINRSSFVGIVAACRRHGAMVSAGRRGGEIVGISVHFEPGRWPIADGAVVYELLWALLAGPLPVRRGIAFDRTVRAAHIDHDHVYLWFLGVRPDAQGTGVGRALLARMHECADRDGVPAYLETGTMANVAWYGSAGYELLEELPLPHGGAPLWRMERPHPSR
jgi:GNAT superfamily N-acetyltransferase